MRRRWVDSRLPLRRARAGAVEGLPAGGVVIALLALLGGPCAVATDADALTPSERVAILALGPWPLAPLRDTSNPASGDPTGIALGESLFHSPRLSPSGVRCASCHEPWRHYADGRAVAQGVAPGSRNTPSLLDAGRHRHFGWDGARDELWRQSLRPLADAREMPASAAHVAALLRGDAVLSGRYAEVFGHPPTSDDDAVARDVGRALAAYVESLATPRTPFDAWRDALAGSAGPTGPPAFAAFPAEARRGLRLFVGQAGCAACHAGPAFSDDAFHVSRVHSTTGSGAPDTGRHGEPANTFRTPGLRDVAATAPYLHDGSAAHLCDAVVPHAGDAGSDAPPLTAVQRRELVAFLQTLSAGAVAPSCDER